MSLVLVDTSIWIDLLGKSPKYRLDPEALTRVATCPPVIQEVLQGIGDDLAHRKTRAAFLAFPCEARSVSTDTYLRASDIFRSGRLRGLTLRSTIDCLIAAIAIEGQLPIWHNDRDFDQIARFTDLKLGSL